MGDWCALFFQYRSRTALHDGTLPLAVRLLIGSPTLQPRVVLASVGLCTPASESPQDAWTDGDTCRSTEGGVGRVLKQLSA